ncbi:uncharacterized protein Z519_02528 [Cladophialophora bantiana CBS 173.52]|uniref:Uncharacterized protein n=1 Tax=Cladophialophora bantiana (strain ATCC 10958 / CBS 173.52 / CDC B-1940 / NIH 8579) TaxID=1442370 RepID=A0A0D2F4I7_CLAB1|nr:uncharacterized protein Z519_02528 [Cladophialophora bantiana CBS 173.52]KIW97136.1 hypothetical protein Z519_02528 [Cladophialophora bantiana CBS 173.52]
MAKFARDDVYPIVRNFVHEAIKTPDAGDDGPLLEPAFPEPTPFLQELVPPAKNSADPALRAGPELKIKVSKTRLRESTFVKYLHGKEQLREAIRVAGTDLQIFLEGRVRRMLDELILHEPVIADLGLDVSRSAPQRLRDRWNFEDIKETFGAVLALENYDLDLTIFLDALDEYHGFPEVISQCILDVVSTSQHSSCRTNVRFCFSSREWDSFVKAFDCAPGVALHEHTYQDLERYAISRPSQLTFQHPFTTEDRSTFTQKLPPAEVVRLVATRAQGVFLCMKLAIDEIVTVQTIPSQEELEKLVSKPPASLEGFYMQPISRIPQHSHFRPFMLSETVSHSLDLVIPPSLFHASAFASRRTFRECEKH